LASGHHHPYGGATTTPIQCPGLIQLAVEVTVGAGHRPVRFPHRKGNI
jgi:hypothetical protein